MDFNERSGLWVKQQSNYSAFIPKALPPEPADRSQVRNKLYHFSQYMKLLSEGTEL